MGTQSREGPGDLHSMTGGAGRGALNDRNNSFVFSTFSLSPVVLEESPCWVFPIVSAELALSSFTQHRALRPTFQ